jgi:hypothetical protein
MPRSWAGVLNIKEHHMGLASIFRVFKNSSIVTDRGEYTISRVFPSRKEAKKARYCFYAVINGITIYRRRAGTDRITYAYIGN